MIAKTKTATKGFLLNGILRSEFSSISFVSCVKILIVLAVGAYPLPKAFTHKSHLNTIPNMVLFLLQYLILM